MHARCQVKQISLSIPYPLFSVIFFDTFKETLKHLKPFTTLSFGLLMISDFCFRLLIMKAKMVLKETFANILLCHQTSYYAHKQKEAQF